MHLTFSEAWRFRVGELRKVSSKADRLSLWLLYGGSGLPDEDLVVLELRFKSWNKSKHSDR